MSGCRLVGSEGSYSGERVCELGFDEVSMRKAVKGLRVVIGGLREGEEWFRIF